MRKFAIIAGLLLSFTACKKDKWAQAVSDEKGFRDKMCACKDKACTEDVHKQYKDWEKGMGEKMGKDEKPPDNVMEEAEKVEKEMKDCRKKFRDADAPAAPTGDTPAAPAAPAPAGSAAPTP
jgi:hypothetical protein